MRAFLITTILLAGLGHRGAHAQSSCPGPASIHFEFNGSFTAGTSERRFTIAPDQGGLHYRRIVLTYEVRADAFERELTSVHVLRNTPFARNPVDEDFVGWSWLLMDTTAPDAIMNLPHTEPADWTPNLWYRVEAVVDTEAGTSRLTMTELEGAGRSFSITRSVSSSFWPVGTGLQLIIGGIAGDTVAAPEGWEFRSIVADLEPGGPFGPDAPACPGGVAITSPDVLPDAILDDPYFFTFSATGSSLTWDALDPLPAGLALDPMSGTLSGVPTVEDTTLFDVRASDPSGESFTASFALTVAAAVAPPPPPDASVEVDAGIGEDSGWSPPDAGYEPPEEDASTGPGGAPPAERGYASGFCTIGLARTSGRVPLAFVALALGVSFLRRRG